MRQQIIPEANACHRYLDGACPHAQKKLDLPAPIADKQVNKLNPAIWEEFSGVFRNSTFDRRLCLRAGDVAWLRKNATQKT